MLSLLSHSYAGLFIFYLLKKVNYQSKRENSKFETIEPIVYVGNNDTIKKKEEEEIIEILVLFLEKK